MKCPHCKSVQLRNSRLRAEDLPLLLLFRVPARCRNCMARCHVSIAAGRQMRQETELRRARERAGKRREAASNRPSELPVSEEQAG